MLIKNPHKIVFFHACADPQRPNRFQPNFAHQLPGGRSNIFDMTSKLVEGVRRGGGAKMDLPH